MTYKTDLEKREKAIRNAIKQVYGTKAKIMLDPEYVGIEWGKSFIPSPYNFKVLDVYSNGFKTNLTNITIKPKGKILLKSKSILKNSKIQKLKEAIEQKSFICDIIKK